MQIGNVTLEAPLMLAPMAGVTDAAFRLICREEGAAFTCTELISSKALCFHDRKTYSLLRRFPGERPSAVQIFGTVEPSTSPPVRTRNFTCSTISPPSASKGMCLS